MNKQRGYTLVESGYVVGILMLLAFGIGWIMNIVKFVGLIGGDVNSWFVGRLVGIVVAPLGGILGFF